MKCSEERLLALIFGDLPPDEAREVDEHLLSCDRCWRAVSEDRIGLGALGALRTPAPEWLAERVRRAIELAAAETTGRIQPMADFAGVSSSSHRLPIPRRRLVAAVAAPVAAAAVILSLLFVGGGSPSEPAQLSAVMALAAPLSHHAKMSKHTYLLNVSGQAMLVVFVQSNGETAAVATSKSPFPMPNDSHLVGTANHREWMGRFGDLSAYCRNGARGERSMLVVAKMPTRELPSFVSHLDVD